MKKLKKILKIIFAVLGLLFIGLLIAAHVLFKPKSDEKIRDIFADSSVTPVISYNNYKKMSYRVIAMQKAIDTTLPVLVFVHGSPGSAMDYVRYLKDADLNSKANLIVYDRVGYGPKTLGKVQESLLQELEILEHLIAHIPEEKIVLAGYSYGGPIVLASAKNYKYKISMASAVVGEYEPMFWMLNFYKWRLTRPLIPAKFKAAAKEKYIHLTDLHKYAEKWSESPAKVLNIHGDKDWIVPYKNSKFLQEKFEAEKFKMVTIKDGGHDLIWSDFDLIKNEILTTLD